LTCENVRDERPVVAAEQPGHGADGFLGLVVNAVGDDAPDGLQLLQREAGNLAVD
jgi:hypothetical protein